MLLAPPSSPLVPGVSRLRLAKAAFSVLSASIERQCNLILVLVSVLQAMRSQRLSVRIC